MKKGEKSKKKSKVSDPPFTAGLHSRNLKQLAEGITHK
jgi:hypothetical protein